ncbi:ATP-binding cassette domain-containing protein [uncultured Capnocytophaga sp.]|jgi:ABC transporter related|uniref:ATP-binding cassette domain-containing protein n=1 Tax=uncultured Capnocytophaga sp. TaxID=159273 RepID=UPI0025948088|nr:ATP-binding cassette domain-containing protein [uncultured Capnocytophaga sp.]
MLNILIKEKHYSDRKILENIQLNLSKTGIYGVVGKNGSGKTTFFKCLSGLTSFKGEVKYNNKKLPPQQVGFLPTEPYLYEHLTVGEFYTFYSLLLGIKTNNHMPFQVDKSLLIRELSTGMRKKVYLNAILQKNYSFYIFDEPFNGLDITSVYQVKKLLGELSQQHIVLVSSHIIETLADCEQLFLVNNKELQSFAPSALNEIATLLSEP